MAVGWGRGVGTNAVGRCGVDEATFEADRVAVFFGHDGRWCCSPHVRKDALALDRAAHFTQVAIVPHRSNRAIDRGARTAVPEKVIDRGVGDGRKGGADSGTLGRGGGSPSNAAAIGVEGHIILLSCARVEATVERLKLSETMGRIT